MTTVGFIGTGTMGEPMARKLMAAGHRLYVHDRAPARVARLVEQGATRCRDSLEVTRHAETVFVMVWDAPQVEEVLFGAGGAEEGLTDRHVLVCLSTLDPGFMRRLGARMPGIALLDAPVSGGKAGAMTADLAIMVGGEHDAYIRVEPILKTMGNRVAWIGPLGCGQVAKAANQIIVAITRAAVGEALLFASRNRTDAETVRKVLMGGLARSVTLETYGARITGLENPVRFESEAIKKDINAVVAAAHELGIELPFAALARDCYNAFVKPAQDEKP